MMTVTDTRYINLNTQQGIPRPSNGLYEKSFLSQIDFSFKDVLKDDDDILYSHVSIHSAQIPVSFYQINYTTNILKFTVDNGVIQTMVIERGNYNLLEIITALKQGFLDLGFTFSITFYKVTGKLTFTILSGGSTFRILSSASGGTINETIGFDSVTSYSSIGNKMIAEHPLSLIGIKKLKVVSSALHTNSLSSGNGGDLLGVIPVNAPPFGLILYSNDSIGGLLKNRNVSNIDITILNEDNRYINFNNTEYSITLAITTTRVLKEQLNTSFRDSTKQILDTNVINNNNMPEPPVFNDENDLDFFMYKHGIDM